VETTVAQLFFYCSNDEGVWIDRRVPPEGNLTDAMQQAKNVVRSLLMEPSPEDWRGWTLHASDENGEEIFAMPFTSVLGKAH
jgi:hypothetical protein